MPLHHKILIVDDNPTNVAILEEMLGETYHLATAMTGEECLIRAVDFQPDVILLDIMMPGITGYETCRRIRAHPALRHTKIIMVSAKAMMSERLQGYEVGADDYLTKPFEEEELLAKVRVYLRLKSIEEVDQLKSDLLTLLNHETRTPLNGILTPVQMLRADADLDAAERTMFLEMVYQSAERLRHLFEQVSTLSAIKSGQWNFEFTPMDLGEIVRQTVCDVSASACSVRIEQDVPEVVLTLLDPAQMQRVVIILLENAIRFSPSEGRVMVQVVRHDKWGCVTVTDQGAGIDTDFLPQVFEEFVHADINAHSAGLGLSLAMARQIVLAHHGTIHVESTKGVGTTFTVQLPIVE